MSTRTTHLVVSLCLAVATTGGCAPEASKGAGPGDEQTATTPATSTPTDPTDPTDPTTPTSPTTPTVPLETVADRLAGLGIDTPPLEDLAPLADRTGRPLAAGSHPLRDPVAVLEGPSELVVVGPGGGGDVLDFDDPAVVAGHIASALEAVAVDPQVVALHLDGDGREEVVLVDLADVNPYTASDLVLWYAEDLVDGLATPLGDRGQDLGEWRASALAASRIDLEGDGIEEVLMAAEAGGDLVVRTLSPLTSTLGAVQSLGPVDAGLTGLQVASGQLDGDPELEAAIVVATDQASRLVVLDNAAGTLSVVFDDTIAMAGGTPILAGGVAFADIDADFVDELVIAGVQDVAPNSSWTQLLVVLEDRVDAGMALRPVFEGQYVGQVPSGAQVRFYDTQVHAGSAGPVATGDAEDVLVNHVLWEWTTLGLADPADPARPVAPREVFTLADGNGQIDFDADEVQFAMGQLDGDGIPEAAVYLTEPGLFQGTTGATMQAGDLRTVPLVRGSGTSHQTHIGDHFSLPARIVAANVDDDAIVVQHLPDEHVMAYSEPVILAAIAAPPCYAGPEGQNTGNCAGTLGATSSTTATAEDSMSVSASMHVGFDVEERLITQSELQATWTLEATTATGLGQSASLEFSRAYTNGSDQNQVLATVLGFEQFAYLVLSAPPRDDGTSLVGQKITVSVPREETLVTRLFSEDLIRPSMRQSQRDMLDSVFPHVPTDPFSYVHPDDLRGLMSGLQVGANECNELTPASDVDLCDWITHLDRVQTPVVSGPLSGVGSSESAVLSMGTSTEQWSSWGVSSTFDLQVTTGGVLYGASVGTAADSTVSVTHGESVELGVEIGAIDPEVYAPYSVALYAYNVQFDCVVDADGVEACDGFQVLNYTVE